MKALTLGFLTLLGCAARSAPSAEPPNYLLESTVYRISASVSGDTSLTEDIRPQGSREPAAAVRGPLTFFTLADLRIGAARFHLDDKGATWDGQIAPPNTEEIILLTRPRMVTAEGVRAEMQIGGEEPISYMSRRADGLFELRTTNVMTGMSTRFTPRSAGAGQVVLDPFVLEIRSVQGRLKVADVQLDIGEPELRADSASLSLCLTLGRPYGILWRSGGEGMLLLVLHVRLMPDSRQ